jgi:hypothetical protein
MYVVITVAMALRLFAVTRFYALWDNIITVAMVTLLKEVINLLHAALWRQCTEIKDRSLVYAQHSKTYVYVSMLRSYSN